MSPTDILKSEHRQIEKLLAVLDVVAERVLRRDVPPAEDLRLIVDLVRGFADDHHHHAEEEHLFPALVEAGLPGDGGPIAVMLAEHEEGRRWVTDIVDSVRVGLDDVVERKRFVHAARGFVELLRHHIHKEDMVLFPLAERTLGGAAKARLYDAFMARGAAGPSIAAIDALASKYLAVDERPATAR